MTIEYKISPHCTTPDGQKLYLTADGQGQVVVKTDLGSNPAQLWLRTTCEDPKRAYIINVATNTCIHIQARNQRVTLIPVPDKPDENCLWNLGARAIQSARNSDWNLNVGGDSYPDGSPVIVWDHWKAGNNECWDWLTVCTPVIDPTRYKISPHCTTPDGRRLFLTAEGSNVLACTDQGNEDVQLWCKATYPGETRAYIVNVKTNTCIHIHEKNKAVELVPIPCTPDVNCLWNHGARAIQSARDTDWNLNVRGDSYPNGTPVIVWDHWEAGDNECWDWHTPSTPVIDPTQYKISPHCTTPDGRQLFLTAKAGKVIAATSLGRAESQLWSRASYPGESRSYIVNVETNTCIRIHERNKAVELTPIPSTPDINCLWNYGARAIQSARDQDWNLNVEGDSYPDGTPVIVWDHWEAGANECWNWIAPHAPTSNTFSVFTYNTHLFDGALASLPHRFWPAAPQVVYRDEDRMDAIINRVIKLSPDIVCLQEIWGEKNRDSMLARLSGMYPYSYRVPGSVITDDDIKDIGKAYLSNISDTIREKIQALIHIGREGLPKFTNGLLVCSRYELLECSFTPYTMPQEAEDRLGKKGLIQFSIQIPTSGNQIKTVRFGTTHAPTTVQAADGNRDESDCFASLRLAAKLVFGDRRFDGILLGDFNVHYFHPEERNELQKLMDGHAAIDIVGNFLPDREDCYTDWPYGNTFHAAISGRPSIDTGKERIDYVLFSASEKNPTLIPTPRPANQMIPKDWTIADASGFDPLDLSDHNPVLATFSFV
jgi:hypothetical protein